MGKLSSQFGQDSGKNGFKFSRLNSSLRCCDADHWQQPQLL